jgi:hypothetical protein
LELRFPSADPVWRGNLMVFAPKVYLLFLILRPLQETKGDCHTFARAATTRPETTARPLACRRQRCPRAPRSSRNIRSVRARPLSPPDEFVLPTSDAPRNLGRRQRACRAHHGLDTAYSTDSATEIRRTGAPDVGREFSVSARLVVVPTKRALPGWTLKRRTTNILFAFWSGRFPATPRRSVHPGSSLTYRASHTNHTRLADKRQAEAQRIRTKYPERIPVRHPPRFHSNRPRLSRAVRGGFCGGKTRGLF